MSERTYWNGEPCEAIRGTGIVQDETAQFAAHWARELVGQRIPVVQVTYGGQTFWLDDSDGQGWTKVTERRGSPRAGHRNLTPADFQTAAVQS